MPGRAGPGGIRVPGPRTHGAGRPSRAPANPIRSSRLPGVHRSVVGQSGTVPRAGKHSVPPSNVLERRRFTPTVVHLHARVTIALISPTRHPNPAPLQAEAVSVAKGP